MFTSGYLIWERRWENMVRKLIVLYKVELYCDNYIIKSLLRWCLAGHCMSALSLVLRSKEIIKSQFVMINTWVKLLVVPFLDEKDPKQTSLKATSFYHFPNWRRSILVELLDKFELVNSKKSDFFLCWRTTGS